MRRVLVLALASGLLAQPAGVALAAPAPEAATAINFGQTLQGSLTREDRTWLDDSRYDRFRFRAEAGTWVTITMDSTEMDTYLHLQKTGEVGFLKRDDDAGEGNNAKIEAFIPVTGEYDIVANGSSDSDLGPYSVKIERLTAPTASRMRAPQPATARTINAGETLRGTLRDSDPAYSNGNPYHLFRLKVKKDIPVTIDLKSSAFGGDMVIRRAGEIGQREDFSDTGSGSDVQMTYEPDADEDLEIVVTRAASSGTGDFSLTVTEKAAGSDDEDDVIIQPISYDRTVRGSLESGDNLDDDFLWYDSYSFQGQAGDSVVITLESSQFDPMIELFDRDDKRIASDDDGGDGLNSRLIHRLPTTGIYYIDVLTADEDDDTGDYVLRLTKQ